MNAILQNDGPRLPLSAPIRIQLEDTQLPYDFWYSLDMFDRFEPTLGPDTCSFLYDVIFIRHEELPVELRAAILDYEMQFRQCVRCGCREQFDEYGDRICWCDSCWLQGCRHDFASIHNHFDAIPHFHDFVFGGKLEIYCDECIIENRMRSAQTDNHGQ